MAGAISSHQSSMSTSLSMLTNDPVAMLVPLPNEEIGTDDTLLIICCDPNLNSPFLKMKLA